MIFELATSIIGVAAVQVAADSPAAVSATSQKATVHDNLLSAETNGNKRKGHRLLQRFKSRRERAYDAKANSGGNGEEADVGVLGGDSRRLQNDYDYYCPRETCPTELCDCADSGGSLEDCTKELKSVCQMGRLGDCVFQDYVQVYEEVYCPFVACTEEGFRENQCDCAFYDLYCDRLVGDECSSVVKANSNAADKKPFFGCDETELKNVCDQAHTCKDKGDLQGLPDLGTWQGTATMGIKSSGERVGGGSLAVAAGVALLSMLWVMVN